MAPLAPDTAATLRAAAEIFVPGPPYDPTPGAAEIAAERFIAHHLDLILDGLADGAAGLLDATAAQLFDGSTFHGLRLSEREIVLESLERHELEQVRELPALLGMLSVAAFYGEWTGQDADGRMVATPVGWTVTGFDGPVRERPSVMRPPV